MLRIGITGGIGAGKSTVSKVFQEMGVPYLNTDQHTKHILNNVPELKAQIIEEFGNASYDDESRYNSLYMATVVFENHEERRKLEKIVGSYVLKSIESWIAVQQAQNFQYVIIESAIFYETGIEHLVDFMIGVSAPEAIRIERVMKNGLSYEQIAARMKAQMNDELKINSCDFIINNNHGDLIDSIDPLHKQVTHLHKLFTKIANVIDRHQ